MGGDYPRAVHSLVIEIHRTSAEEAGPGQRRGAPQAGERLQPLVVLLCGARQVSELRDRGKQDSRLILASSREPQFVRSLQSHDQKSDCEYRNVTWHF